MGTEQTAVVSFSSSPEQNNREAMFDITFKEVDKLTRQAETRAHQLGPRLGNHQWHWTVGRPGWVT